MLTCLICNKTDVHIMPLVLGCRYSPLLIYYQRPGYVVGSTSTLEQSLLSLE